MAKVQDHLGNVHANTEARRVSTCAGLLAFVSDCRSRCESGRRGTLMRPTRLLNLLLTLALLLGSAQTVAVTGKPNTFQHKACPLLRCEWAMFL